MVKSYEEMTNRELQDEFDRLTETMKACAGQINECAAEAARGEQTAFGRQWQEGEIRQYNALHAQRQQIDLIWLSR